MYKILNFFLLSILTIGCSSNSPEIKNTETSEISDYKGTGQITQGPANKTTNPLIHCTKKGSRIGAVGEIKDLNGKTWIVPGKNNYKKAMKAFDLYNECNDVTPNSLSEVKLNSIPIAEINTDGELVVGYIFADNYFELYINGKLVAVDPVPFTPFNSNIVKFRVKKPYTIAVKLIDWEENLGLGSEKNKGSAYHPGDGGFIASFSDGTVTNGDWKAQTFYTAPINDLSCLKERGEKRLSLNCHREGVKDASLFYGVHWPTPEDSFDDDFDDSDWPNANIYTENEIDVNNKKAYTNFVEKFTGAGAAFIWSTNIVLDNEVIVRYTVE